MSYYARYAALLALLAFWMLPSPSVTSAAEPQHFSAQSGPQTVALVELYTSEGCNSCPPADTWISSLPQHGFATNRVIPLGLHVDYWDYLGWPDRFAQAIFTERQRTIAAWHRTRTIYTPQLVVQGEDFRRWGSLERRLEQINATPARAQLRLHVTVQTPATLAVDAEAVVSAGAERQDARLYMALYENNLRSQVTAGENSGHTLQHDFVVRQWLEPLALDQTQGRVQVQRTLSVPRDWKLADLGLVMFVQNHRSGEVLQALALALR